MENLKGVFVEKQITSNETFQLGNTQDIYFKNLGSTEVKVGIYPLRPDQEKYIHTGNITLESRGLEIFFVEGAGKTNNLYISYIKMPECTCD
ncbi:hypothetical protein [Tenacibaculum aiptasiae]|uniref:hypothetical protein n=1 Tax=Tenacibaculum aiptasiae TaxID=426481 RepID=UPI00232DC0A4|nr:hypothetical protein [Tenacibaculum aiptasiae]